MNNNERRLCITITKDREPVASCSVTTHGADGLLRLLEQSWDRMREQAGKLSELIQLQVLKYGVVDTMKNHVSIEYVAKENITVTVPITVSVPIAYVYAAAVSVAVLQDTDRGLENLRSDLRRFIAGFDVESCVPFLPTIGILPK